MHTHNGSRCAQLPDPPAGPRRSAVVRILLIAVVAGVAVRSLAFAVDLEIYFDAAYFMNGLLVRDYGELLQPLANFQVAPPAFCVIVKWCSEWAESDRVLRLLPFAAGLSSLLVFAALCRAVLRGSAAWFALAILSSSHVAIIASTRVRPYSSDLLVGVTIVYLAVRWISRPERSRYLIAAAMLAPFAVWLSYTSVFVIGGVGPVLVTWAVVNRRKVPVRAWTALITTGLLAMASFGALYESNLKGAMSNAETPRAMYDTWQAAFPPSHSFLQTVWWLVKMHTGRLYSYPVGEKNFGSILSFACWCFGLVALYRKPQGMWLLAILLAPQVLLLAAAFAGKYPYGAHARISLFLAPSMCLLIGAGVARWTHLLRRSRRRRWRTVVATFLLLIPIGGMVKVTLDALAVHRGPSVRGMLLDLREQIADDEPVYCLNAQMITQGGGAARQIFEYYMQRTFGERVRWAWDGGWPISRSSGRPTRVTVIEFTPPHPSDGSADAVRAGLQARYGPPFDPQRARGCAVLPGYPGEMRIYQLVLKPDLPPAP